MELCATLGEAWQGEVWKFREVFIRFLSPLYPNSLFVSGLPENNSDRRNRHATTRNKGMAIDLCRVSIGSIKWRLPLVMIHSMAVLTYSPSARPLLIIYLAGYYPYRQCTHSKY